jgi:hypothetical protein
MYSFSYIFSTKNQNKVHSKEDDIVIAKITMANGYRDSDHDMEYKIKTTIPVIGTIRRRISLTNCHTVKVV